MRRLTVALLVAVVVLLSSGRSFAQDKVLEVGSTDLKLEGKLGDGTSKVLYKVRLVQGTSYKIDMTSPDFKALDPYLRLYAMDGKQIAEDDDGGGGLNARIVFTAPATGTYQVEAASFGNRGDGPFTLRIQPVSGDENVALTFNQNLVGANKRLETAGAQLGKAIIAAVKTGETKDARAKLQAIRDVVKAIKAETKLWKVPASESGKKLLAGYEKFLKSQDAGVAKFGEVITVLEDKNLSAEEKTKRIQEVAQQFQVDENAVLRELQELQREFAREYKINLK